MRKFYLLAILSLFMNRTFATGEPSTYFNIFVPPNNDAVHRDVCLIITAIYDSTSFSIVDDGMDGDTDDSKTGILMAGQSYILYIKDNGINDDASLASNGVLKQDGDYFVITSDKLVFASQSTDSDWQHDWLPSVNKKSIGEKFIIYAPKITSSLRDVNVFAYSDSTLVKIKKISTISKMTTGYTTVNMNNPTTVATFSLNVGEDIIYKYAFGRNVLQTGETYLIESSKPVTVQYGALYVNERDGGGYVPASNGSSAGELFYFGVPYQAVGEQEIRIVSWDNTNNVTLERYSSGSWITMNTWTLNHFQPCDWVGRNNGNASYPTVFRVKCSPGKKVSIFEGNWFETGSPGTSDMATMVSSDNGTSSGKNFLVYMAPPGNEQSVTNPFTNLKFNQRLTHIYLFAKKNSVVTVKDSYTNGGKVNRSYTIQAGRYVDCFLTETEWKNIYNGTGTNAGPERPYLTVSSNEDISLMNTNFNDNWMMYFGSALPQSVLQTSSSSQNNAVPGDTVTFRSDITFTGSNPMVNPSVEVNVTSGATVTSSKLVDVQNTDTIAGTVSQTVNKTVVTFDSVPNLNPSNQYYVETSVLVVPVNNQGTSINNTIVSVETIVTGKVAGETQQSVVSDGLTVNRVASVDVTAPTIIAPPNISTNPNAAGCVATVDLGTPVTNDNVGVIYTSNNAPATYPIGSTVVTWTTYDAAGNSATATQTVTVIAPVITPPAVASTSICSGNSVVLNATAPSGTFEWYNASSGGSLLQNGPSYQTPILNNSVTYYVLNNINGCKSDRTPLIVVVKATPAPPVVLNPIICSGNSVNMSAVVPSGDVEWYDTNYNLIINSPNLTTPVLQNNTTYYVKNIANGCVGVWDTVLVTVKQTPVAPTAANVGICLGSTANLSATAPGGTYQWFDAPVNGNLLQSGANYSVSNLNANQNYYVQTNVNGCISDRSTVLVSVAPTVPDVISPTINGLVLLCQEDTLTYTCGGANYGELYNWAVPTGMQIIAGQGTRNLTVVANPAIYVTGAISVYASNACGNSNTRYLDMNLSTTIAGPDEVCTINSATYSVHPVNGASSYTWTLPNGMTGASTTNSITVAIAHPGFTTGTITVKANASCGSTLVRTKSLSAIISIPGIISGATNNVCAGSTQSYSVSPVVGATSYNWTAPVGADINGTGLNIYTGTNNAIQVVYPAGFVNGSVMVSASNACNTSAARSIAVMAAPIASSPGVITGPTNVCSVLGTGGTVTYSVPTNGRSYTYLWTVPSNASLVSGQGTSNITVQYSSAFNAGNITVAIVGTCVNSAVRTLGVYKAPGAVGAISGPSDLCQVQGITVTYSVALVPDATGYLWTVPNGASIVSGASTNVIHVLFPATVTAGSSIKVRATNSCGGSAIRTLDLNQCGTGKLIADQVDLKDAIFAVSEPYPNPAQNVVSLNVSVDEVSQVNIDIYDMLGKKVRIDVYQLDLESRSLDVPVEEFARGVYYLHILNATNGKTIIKRFVKS